MAQFHMFPQRDKLKNCFCMMTLDKKLILGPQIQITPFVTSFQRIPIKIKRWLVAGWGRTKKQAAPGEGSDLSIKSWNRELRATLAEAVADCGKFYPEAKDEPLFFCLGMEADEKTSFGDQGGPVYSIEENVVYGMIINGETDTQGLENDDSKPMLMAPLYVAREWIDLNRVEEEEDEDFEYL